MNGVEEARGALKVGESVKGQVESLDVQWPVVGVEVLVDLGVAHVDVPQLLVALEQPG